MNEFKRQYQEKHRSQGKGLALDLELKREEPQVEKSEAQQLVDRYHHLEEIIEKGGRSSRMAEDHLEKLADKMSRKKDVMEHVRQHHPEMEKEINQMTKDIQKERDFGLEL